MLRRHSPHHHSVRIRFAGSRSLTPPIAPRPSHRVRWTSARTVEKVGNRWPVPVAHGNTLAKPDAGQGGTRCAPPATGNTNDRRRFMFQSDAGVVGTKDLKA